MKITLEMVDQVIERTGADYQVAKDALLEVDGDVLEAIVLIESKITKPEENIMIQRLKELVDKGKISRIIVERDGINIINIPVIAGVIGGVLLSSTAIIIAITTAIISGCDLYVIDSQNNKINVKEYTKEKYDQVVNKKSNE